LAEYQATGEAIKDAGLECTAVTIVPPEANPTSPDAGVRAKAVDRLKWAIDRCVAGGSKLLCGPFHSPLGVFPGHGPTEDERKHGADTLRKVADVAAGAGVTLAIEYVNRFECYFLTTAAETAALVKAVDHPQFRCMYDTFHAHIEEKRPADAIALLAPHLAHLHVSENDRGTLGTGQVAWRETFAALKKANYDGWLMIEGFGRALKELIPATKIWRELYPDPDEPWREGIKFMKSQTAS
jgi:D-psicose/D-tagatose/L-ribulose 3-epimerase